jgi:AraC family transcriptional regulator, arabinose operon regulatory protein
MKTHKIALQREFNLSISSYVKIAPGSRFEGAKAQWVMGLTLAGACDFGQPGGKRFLLKKGDFMLIRPYTPQSWVAIGKTAWRTIYCIFEPRPQWIPWFNWEEILPGFMKRTVQDPKTLREIRDGLMQASRLQRNGLPDGEEFAYNALERVFLLANHYFQFTSHPEYDPRIAKSIRYLANNISAPLSLKEIATHSNLSRAHFAYLFKKQVGVGPLAFQQQQRIVQAKQMLRMSFLSIKQIAFELGFQNPKYFSSCFRKATGTSPRQYRGSH